MIHPAYVILTIHGSRLLLCLLCHRYSTHARDISEHFCGHCRCWLDTVPRAYDPLIDPPLPSREDGEDHIRQRPSPAMPGEDRLVLPLFNAPPEETAP